MSRIYTHPQEELRSMFILDYRNPGAFQKLTVSATQKKCVT